jgi:hypothetical protein
MPQEKAPNQKTKLLKGENTKLTSWMENELKTVTRKVK